MDNTVHTYEIGYIGHKADQLQALFPGYTTEPNEYGKFLRFENIDYIGNKGVICYTNCFESEEHLNERLLTKLLGRL